MQVAFTCKNNVYFKITVFSLHFLTFPYLYTIILKNILKNLADYQEIFMAPRVGFEPTTLRLTAACSTVELSRKIKLFF